jgi:MFS-type transporter involved in bile tolerance (Atg22 family)
LLETFDHAKKDKNIWVFCGSYCLIYGSFQTFASSANLLIKPFGANDIDISIAALCLIFFGAVGAVLSSLYLKKHRKYRRIFRTCCIGSLVSLICLAFQLAVIQQMFLIKINIGILGFFLTPIIPLSYELGC